MKIGNRIKELRKINNWSQEQLADKLDVTRQTIISLEKGKYIASLPLAYQLSCIFQCKIEDVYIFEMEDGDV